MNMSKITHVKEGKQQGFVMLFVILAISVMVTAAAGIASFAQKESFLGSVSTESQIALYAADTGADCALAYVRKLASTGNLPCMGNSMVNESGVAPLLEFPFDYTVTGNTNPSCGKVIINPSKTFDVSGTTVNGIEIQSFGYNTCTFKKSSGLNISIRRPNTEDPLLLERRFVIRIAQ